MEWLLRTLSFLQLVLLNILRPYFWYRDRAPPKVIPINKNTLLRLSACEIARRIRNGDITSETVVSAYIERIKGVNPVLHAVIEDRFEAALKDAKECDKKLASGELSQAQLEIKMPFFGVPFTVKESCSLKGLSQTGCLPSRQGIKAAADSPIVESMKKAGAIPLCVTNTPEQCAGFDAANLLFGRTLNPYDTRRIAGGSSGGEAALLGAGASLIGIGSDIAGSIRVPALFNGVFGHKPSSEIIPITGHYPMSDDELFQKYLVLGPLTRYVEDLVAAVRVMSGEKSKILRLDETVDLKKLRVFYREDAGKSFGVAPVDISTRTVIKRAVTHLKTCTAEVRDAPVGSLTETLEITVASFFGMKKLPALLVNPADPKNEFNPIMEMVKAFLGMSQFTKSAIYMQILRESRGFMSESSLHRYRQKGQELRTKFVEMLGDDAVFLYPTFVSAAPPVGEVNLQTTGSIYCLLVNIFGFPATQIPMGLDRNGLPLGFQVIAGPNQDRLCLAVAKELEKRFGGWIAPTVISLLDDKETKEE
ncbi:fatty-acid amide hydrolase 2-like [Venturia canescens]|uniref:fatty-acid amide hydrolase 2-like n=1 Tax=Venturia canescens TaxID=32260 RepID=UPI001C9C8755|nr:fatty-acid amide hydrolase 2-like [Venturia canescens]